MIFISLAFNLAFIKIKIKAAITRPQAWIDLDWFTIATYFAHGDTHVYGMHSKNEKKERKNKLNML